MKHHEPVGGHLVASYARALPEETAGAVLARIAAEKPASVELVLVVRADGRLGGVVPLQRLFAASAHAPLARLQEAKFPRITPGDDQEHAASLALHYGVDALPVVDADDRPLGVMPSQARHAIEEPPIRRVGHRLPWLLAGLAGSALATLAMAGFESTLSRHIAVAFFVPGIVYLADAIGTQTEAVAVRGLSLTRSGIGHLLAGELRTGMLIGASLGLISFVPVYLFVGEVKLAGAVATAIFAAGTAAAGLGMLLPWLIARSGRDPAFGSGPLATVIQDIFSLLVYFAVVRAFGL